MVRTGIHQRRTAATYSDAAVMKEVDQEAGIGSFFGEKRLHGYMLIRRCGT